MRAGSGYGQTPLDGDELDALLPEVRELLSGGLTKAAVYDLEQAFQEQVAEELLTDDCPRQRGRIVSRPEYDRLSKPASAPPHRD